MPWKLLVRDAAVLAASVAAWRAANAAQSASGGAGLAMLAGAAGVGLALAWGFVGHEWGHYTGARAARSAIRPAQRLGSPTVFRFPVSENSRGQFLSMAWGGLLGVWAPPLLFALILPASAAGLAALLVSAAGALYTTGVEGPVVWRVSRGGELPGAAGG